jgi:acetylornithine deacetylase/succinyl-diaminopimelate desuccinylase-like protein
MANESAYLESLKQFLRIPSISADPEHKPDICRAAEFCANELRQAGMSSVELIESEHGWNPLVYAEWLDAPGKPTLLFYGHYDVQPPDPLEEWTSPPFEPAVRGDNLFARGASDDKGQTFILFKAVESLLRDTGRLPVNVKFLIEGEEETGGDHISAYVAGKPPRLSASAAVICGASSTANCMCRAPITICTLACTAGLRRILFRRSPRFSAPSKTATGGFSFRDFTIA